MQAALKMAPVSAAEALRERIAARTARVGVVGLGYVGLPLALEFAKAGFSVTGIDVQEEKVARLNWGDSYIQDVPSDLLTGMVNDNRFSATRIFR